MEFKPRKMPGGDRFYLKNLLAFYLKKASEKAAFYYLSFTLCLPLVRDKLTPCLPFLYLSFTFCLPRRYPLGKQKVMPGPFDAGNRVVPGASCLPACAQIAYQLSLKVYFGSGRSITVYVG